MLKRRHLEDASNSDDVSPAKLLKIKNEAIEQFNKIRSRLKIQRAVKTVDHTDSSARTNPDFRCKKALSLPKRNIDRLMYPGSKELDDYCPICEQSTTSMVVHFVHKHPEHEVFPSRVSPEMADQLRTTKPEVTRTGRSKLKALCHFCQDSKQFVKGYWLTHISGHTGEYNHYCVSCNHKFAEPNSIANSIHKFHNCKSKNPQVSNLHVIPFDHSLEAYLCNICNYVQMREIALVEHVRVQHVVTINIQQQYQKVCLLHDQTEDL